MNSTLERQQYKEFLNMYQIPYRLTWVWLISVLKYENKSKIKSKLNTVLQSF